jgi:L-arabinose isomerase
VKIAILGWGSLLWDNRPEFDQWHEPWQYDGPTLKLEFSRISESRLNALTLVIDEANGAPTCVAWCLSKRTNPGDGVCDLRCREGTTLRNIGRIDVAQQAKSRDHAAVQDAIACWAREKCLDAVVWTALESNFQQKTGQQFSVGAALRHLKGLTAEGKAMAAEYVWRAPDFVRTPLRTALEGEPWFSQASS